MSVASVEYVLDTNVIRSVPTRLLRIGRDTHGVRFLVSPLSVWELVSHFEDGRTKFEECRGWFCKLLYCEVIDHPEAEIREVIGVAPHIPPEHRIAWLEREAALALVHIFERARSAADVHASAFKDSLGSLRTVANCGPAARAVLAVLEADHIAIGNRLLDGFRNEFARLQRDPRRDDVLSDREFWEHVVREVRRIAATADTPTIEHIEERIFENMFVRLGHVNEAVLRALRTGATLDGNDYEDALLCNAIDLATDRVLVTADLRVLDALVRTERRYRAFSAAHGLPVRSTQFAMEFNAFRRQLDDLEMAMPQRIG